MFVDRRCLRATKMTVVLAGRLCIFRPRPADPSQNLVAR